MLALLSYDGSDGAHHWRELTNERKFLIVVGIN